MCPVERYSMLYGKPIHIRGRPSYGSCKRISVSLTELQRRGIDMRRRQNKHRKTYQRDARGVRQTIGFKNGVKS